MWITGRAVIQPKRKKPERRLMLHSRQLCQRRKKRQNQTGQPKAKQ